MDRRRMDPGERSGLVIEGNRRRRLRRMRPPGSFKLPGNDVAILQDPAADAESGVGVRNADPGVARSGDVRKNDTIRGS